MKSISVFIISILLVACAGCKKKEPVVQKPVQVNLEQKKSAFIPPADSIVAISQMKSWLRCNPLLDSLSILYKDSLTVTDATRQMRYQDAFIKAQDMICVRVGLSGGYAEYLWILRNIGSPKNAATLDSLKLTAYNQ